jgi:Flp pilus assembly pilin Flp
MLVTIGRVIAARLADLWENESGQDMVEYSLLLAFIALAAVALFSGVKNSIKSIWTTISSNLSTAAS